MKLLNLTTRPSMLAWAAMALASTNAHSQAFLQDMMRTTTETKNLRATYDLPGQRDAKRVQEAVHKALTLHGDNAFVRTFHPSAEPPENPQKMVFRSMNFGPVSVQIPQCEGAAFTISSNDGSMARWGDSANYMACGFPYQGGMRVTFFAQSQSTNGGVGGLLSGKTLGKMLAGAVGINSDPMAFVEASLAKLESQWRDEQTEFALVDMVPLLGQRTVVADRLAERQKASEQRAANRSKRLAARAEMQKLGVDAADQARFLRAIQSGDEDLVALFLEAGAVDPQQPTPDGRKPIDLAQRPAIRSLLERP